jgi:WD40 repeat protein
MSFRLRLFFTAILLASLVTLCAAKNKHASDPAQSTYLLTNDDGLLHSYVSFFVAGGTQGAPTLTFQSDTNTGGEGIGGGFFGLPRVNLLPDSSAQCVYASNGGSGDISVVNIQSGQLAGTFAASPADIGDADGIGVVLNSNYLYAAYSDSDTIATFSVLPGCQLSYLSDLPVAGLNGGLIAGVALNGNMLVVAYGDGSIESFNVSSGLPVSNNDLQNSTGYVNGAFFPEGVDITQDGHFAVFGDSSLASVIEVSDISSGKLTQTVQYTVPSQAISVATTHNSGSIRLSPDESMIFMGNNDGGSVAAVFFDKRTGKVTAGCQSPSLGGFYNPWAFVGSVATRDTTGSGGALYVAEYGFNGSYIGILNINTNGTTCTLTEAPNSQVPDLLSDGLLSITVFPPRPF